MSVPHYLKYNRSSIFLFLFITAIVGFGMWYQSGTPSRTQATLQSTLANSGKAGDAIIKSFNSPNQVVPTKTGSGFEIQDNLDGTSPNNFTINFPTQYADHITTVLPGGKTITIRDTNAKNTKGTLLSDQTNQKTKNNPAYIEYKIDERKTIYYAYQKDKASGEKKLKNWILYRTGTGTESESYQFENARITLEKNGSATVYYQDNLPASLAVMPFSLPRPFFINKDGEKVDLDWKLNEKNDTLSIDFSVAADKYPIVLDPTVVFSPSVTNAAWQATPTSNTSTTLADYQTTPFTTGNYTSTGTDDTDYATTTASYPTYVEDVFSAYTYTGNGSTQTINNGINLASKGGLVWLKNRGYNGAGHTLWDTVRGNTHALYSYLTNADATASGYINSFNSTGFTLGTGDLWTNNSPYNYVSWTFAQAPKFFKVAQVTVSGSNQTVDLSSLGTVGMVTVKRTDSTSAWYTWHRSQTSGKLTYLNTTAAETTDGSITLSGTTLTLVQSVIGNGTYIVYAWAHDTSATGLIQCGNFTTDGSGMASVTLGWEPQYVMTKISSGTSDWFVQDTMRGWGQTQAATLNPNLSGAETNTGTYTDWKPIATGFVSSGGTFGANQTVVYCAIRRGPMKAPTSGTQVYNAIAFTGSGVASKVTTGVGFPPDFVIQSTRSPGGDGHGWNDRLRMASNESNSTAVETAPGGYYLASFNMDGVTDGTFSASKYDAAGQTKIFHFLRRYPGVFDEVAYTGNGTTQAITHNLGVVPELIIAKARSAAGNSWPVYNQTIGASYLMILDGTDASSGPAVNKWGNNTIAVSPTASQFTIGLSGYLNLSAETYVAYLFATKAGISKVGSYTGNGTSQTLDAGFTGGAKFVMIKRTDSTGDWYVWDTTRGIPAGNDPHFSLNTTAAEVTTTDDIDADNSGFIVNQNATTNINVNAATYIYLAFSGDTVADSASKYATNLYTFDTTGSSNISKLHIDLTAYATASAGNGIVAKIWNNNSSAWETLTSLGNTASSMPGSSSSQEITSSIANYLDGSNKVKLLVSSINPSVSGTDAVLYADYAKLTATASPVVSSINPTTASNTNQVVSGIALTGTNFEAGATVTFRKTGQTDIPCTSVSVSSVTALTCSANFRGAVVGTWDIVVTNTDSTTGTLSNGLTITEAIHPQFTVVGSVGVVSSGARTPETPWNNVAPAVTGTTIVSQTLSCSTGTWYGTPTITYTYQWQHTTTNIGSATSSTYVIDAAYVGETIRCVVTATSSVGSASANSNNTSAVQQRTVEYLVVAGGGGGGAGHSGGYAGGGGGGAGGFTTATGYAVTPGVGITVTVGGGGAGSPVWTSPGSTGSNSVFGAITSNGGGGGGSAGFILPTAGGSGGGAAGSEPDVGASGITGQGNTGGRSPIAGTGSGGGGGAGTVGLDGAVYNGGNGGAGLASSISGSPVYYAGGGGGSEYSGTAGTGGVGGGGAGGADASVGVNGTVNTGGGGGGGGSAGTGSYAGGAGGSGIVIVRYFDTYPAASATTGSPTYTVSGGYRIYKWTTVGSGSITF